MKAVVYRRRSKSKTLQAPPARLDLAQLGGSASYVCSPEHKDRPVGGVQPRPRPDASICDIDDAHVAEGWVRDAIRSGKGSDWRAGYPRYVWHKEGQRVYEGRLTNAGKGEYKGYPILIEQAPKGL